MLLLLSGHAVAMWLLCPWCSKGFVYSVVLVCVIAISVSVLDAMFVLKCDVMIQCLLMNVML